MTATPTGPVTVFPSEERAADTYESLSVPTATARMVAFAAVVTAGDGTVLVTVETTFDGTTWLTVPGSASLTAAGTAQAIIVPRAEDGIGIRTRIKAVVSSAAATFAAHALIRE